MATNHFSYRSSLVTIGVLLLSLTATAQGTDYASTKEKVYLHTNHVFFKPGEQVFFKLYVVNARLQTPSFLSKIVYAELIDPSGKTIKKANYKITYGYAEGSFNFDEQAPGGSYKIKAYTTYMRNEQESACMVKEIMLQKVIAPRVLMKLDIPGKGYGAGDEVRADYSMRNLRDEPITHYEAAYTVAIGGQVIATYHFKTDNHGKATIRFPLPATLNSHDGLLNVTVQYNGYTESIARTIPILLNKVDLQFMPEGGTLVENIDTWVAFKALNEHGKAADIKGEIRDNLNNPVCQFASYHMGMGKFRFTPQKGSTYHAVITSPASISQTFQLPAATPRGVVLHVSKANKQLTVGLHSSMATTVKLQAASRGQVYYAQQHHLQQGENSVTLPEKDFPAGITQVTLFDKGGLPLAERLVFLHEDQHMQVRIHTDKKRYLPREKVQMAIQTLDKDGKPVPANVSLSVVDDKLWTMANDKQDNILSWLLMSSELKGRVEEPFFYFKKDEPAALPALDLVMLTHGYRYFDYTEIVEREGRLMHSFDQENILNGVVTGFGGQPVMAEVFLVDVREPTKTAFYRTGADGVFYFSDLIPRRDYQLLAKALNKQPVTIAIQENGMGNNPHLLRNRVVYNNQLSEVSISEDQSRATDLRKAPAPKTEVAAKDRSIVITPDLTRNLKLDEVVVVAYSTELSKERSTGSFTVMRSISLIAPLTQALQGKVAGLSVTSPINAINNPVFTVRGKAGLYSNNDPIVVVNGMIVSAANLQTMDFNDVESVTVLKDAAATAIWGCRSGEGVVLIETRKPGRETIRIPLSKPGYYAAKIFASAGIDFTVPKKFYAPRYESTLVTTRTDFRETIYWNPVVQTDKEGKAQVEFYNSDASTTFRALAEGIGYNGTIGRQENTYAVQTDLQVDAKIPPYLTVGDEALIPLVITNNSLQPQRLVVTCRLPDEMVVGRYNASLSLLQDSTIRILIPVKAVKPVKGTMVVEVSSASIRETVSLPVEASPKGFEMSLTFSGHQTAKQEMIIHDPIPGSIRGTLKLFADPEKQLLDGIESLLREPHGCFEQTSSTLYPNIFILKYLRSAGKVNPEVQQKALHYISNGYKRLIGFETAEHGFEWFGRTPPHEALTAYGLMQFMEMKNFIDVDDRMLQRTKDFLLKRRDGKGGFNMTAGKYGFASVPPAVANCYIVYALTQSGLGREIETEYQAAVKKALATKDGYQLVMMALAAANMNRDANFRQLMDLADNLYRKNDLRAAATIVNSGEGSMKAETHALYALALMREKQPPMATIVALIGRLMKNKTSYGYGSTQATALTLQAMVEFAKFRSKVSEQSTLRLIVNNKTVKNGDDIAGVLQAGINELAAEFGDTGETLPYSIEVFWHTLQPPASEQAELKLATRLMNTAPRIGETVRMEIEVTNQQDTLQPMAIAKIGIPAGLSVQPWQLKEIMERNEAAYYEIFDNWLVFYWMGFTGRERKKISLDLKAEIPGTYKAKAGNVYLYYTPEHKHWIEGTEVQVKE